MRIRPMTVLALVLGPGCCVPGGETFRPESGVVVHGAPAADRVVASADLSANRTLSMPAATGAGAGYMTTAQASAVAALGTASTKAIADFDAANPWAFAGLTFPSSEKKFRSTKPMS